MRSRQGKQREMRKPEFASSDSARFHNSVYVANNERLRSDPHTWLQELWTLIVVVIHVPGGRQINKGPHDF